jgi:hypothetical protein
MLLDASRVDLHQAWSATTHAMQALRDNPVAADQEYERIADTSDPGLAPRVTFDPHDDVAAPFIANRRAARGGDSARAGCQRPGRDGSGVRPRRVSPRTTCT